MLILELQTGIHRTVSETQRCLQDQLDLACDGVESRVTEKQKATGTKDKITEYWIEQLLQRHKKMKIESPRRSSQSISDELKQWLINEPGEKMNPLLDIEGTLSSMCTDPQISTLTLCF